MKTALLLAATIAAMAAPAPAQPIDPKVQARIDRILKATLKDLYEGVPMDEVRKCVVLAARTLIEKDPAYSFVTARLLLDAIRFEALGEEATHADMATRDRKSTRLNSSHELKSRMPSSA